MTKMHVARIFMVVISCLAFTSCASLLNKPTTKISFHSRTPTKIIYEKDTLQTQNNQLDLVVPRSKTPLKIQVISDTTKQLTIYPKNSLAYFANFALSYGFLYDYNKPKRYTYPANIYTSRDYLPKDTSALKKSQLRVNISLPYVNSFVMQPKGEGVKNNTGFFGAGFGLDYFYSDKQFVNITMGIAVDFFVSVPAAVDRLGEFENMNTVYFTLSNNHLFGRFSFGFGPAIYKNHWSRHFEVQQDDLYVKQVTHKSNDGFGVVVSADYRLGRTFHVGLAYRPSFGALSGGALLYEHVVSLEAIWKVRL